MSEKIFVKGFKIDKKEFSNGGFIIKLGIKVSDFIDFLSEYQKGEWINIDIKQGKDSGKMYAELQERKINE